MFTWFRVADMVAIVLPAGLVRDDASYSGSERSRRGLTLAGRKRWVGSDLSQGRGIGAFSRP